MLNSEELEQIFIAVEELNIFRRPRVINPQKYGGLAAVEGEVSIDNCEVTLSLVLDHSFPLVLPRFFISPWDALGIIPHVTPDGFICSTDPEGLIIDRRRPVEVIENTFRLAKQVLEDGLHGANQADFLDEFEAYWNLLKNGQPVYSLLEPGDQVEEITIALEKDKPAWVARYSTDLLAFHNNNFEGSFTQQNAIFIPLSQGTIISAPRPDIPFWSTEDVRNEIFSRISKDNRARLLKTAQKYHHLHEYIIVSIPRPSGGSSLFGIQYQRADRYHPLLKNGAAKKVIPLQIHRVDQNYLVPRGGAEVSLTTKRVLVVGCGSIGGHLIFELARAGIQDITVVDPDFLSPENTFRHVLGRRYWFKPKVEAIKEEIEKQIPYLRITAVKDRVEHAISSGKVKLAAFDLIISATGNPTLEMEINQEIHKLRAGPLGLFAWLEPLGIGGHVLLTNNVSGNGCFECLFTSMIDGDFSLENRASFAESGQHFGRAISGCGTLFTPYGSVDAVRTATLAIQLIADVFTGKEKGNPLFSWKGDATTFVKSGYKVSRRYDASEEELTRLRYQYYNSKCPVCGNCRRSGLC